MMHGSLVYPAEVVKILVDRPGVAEVAVVSAPDEKWGERIVAVVVPKAGVSMTDDELRDLCRGKIADYKILKQIDYSSEPCPRPPWRR